MELLVVISIIGVLIALLLPAVQAARESARRLACVNKLKQISLAALTYEQANGQLPPAGDVEYRVRSTWSAGQRVEYELFRQDEGNQLGWLVFLLPYLEQQPLSDQFDLELPVYLQPDRPHRQWVDSFLCPSDDAPLTPFIHPQLTAGREFAKGNYAAFCSPFHTDLQVVHPGAIAGRGLPARRIVDGFSNTLAFSEVRRRDAVLDERGAWTLPWNAASLLAFDMHHDSRQQGFLAPFFPFGGKYRSSQVVRIDEQTQMPNSLGPNLDVIHECPEIADAQLSGLPCLPYNRAFYLSSAPRSRHVGGVNAGYLDGRVDFLPNEIDAYLMASLVSVEDGSDRPAIDSVSAN